MSKKVKVLNMDRGGEYQVKDFTAYLKSKGTVQKLNVHDTPQQAGVARRWYQKLVEIMTKLKFMRSKVDSAVFHRRDELLKMLIIILVHVDDCSIAGCLKSVIQKFKLEIQKYVQITDLGDLHWILGIEVCQIWEDKRIMLSQHSYTQFYGAMDLMTLNPFPLP